ncbi:MAG TPA: FAD-binding protein [Nocardioides sp.]|nr:FAD-binding protein [Nocardioides sp.]
MTEIIENLDLALDALQIDMDGRLARPCDADWDDVRRAWHLELDQRPTAVALPESSRDVQTVVDAARRAGLRVAPQSTGHNAAPLGDLSGTILLSTSRMRGVTVDVDNARVRVEAGAQWGDVTPWAALHGLAALAGSAADVGVAGYVLGGGVSWLGRTHGLAANSVLSLEVVTADGVRRTVDATHEPELFWALRGGGGSFAVVTAIELQLYPISTLVAGHLFFPIERAAEVLHRWAAIAPGFPDEVTSVGRMLRFPPLPDLPPQLAGHDFVLVEIASQLGLEETGALVAPLRELGPQMDTISTTATVDLDQLHMDPPGPVPGFGDGFILDELTPQAVDALLVAAGPGSGSQLLSVELRQLGGALTPGRVQAGAVDGIPGAYLGFAVGIVPSPDAHLAVAAEVAAVQLAMAPWSSGRQYQNFTERSRSGEELFGAETHRRLRAVKARYDATDLIRANHPVAPLG